MTEEGKRRLYEQLIIDEAMRLAPYRCPAGKLTLGVGHNLDAKPISRRAAMVILEDDCNDVFADLDRALPWWREMPEAIQGVLANMCFNLGVDGLLKFKNTLAAFKAKNWTGAANGMRTSLWYTQTGNRAQRLEAIVRAQK